MGALSPSADLGSQSGLSDQTGHFGVAVRKQDRTHDKQRRSSWRGVHQKQKASRPVQTYMDVGVQLIRTVHWKWGNDSESNVVSRETRFTMDIDPEITRWLKQRGMLYRKSRAKIVSPKLGRPCWELFFHFTNAKDARYFALVWQTKSIGAEELRSLLNAGRTKMKAFAG